METKVNVKNIIIMLATKLFFFHSCQCSSYDFRHRFPLLLRPISPWRHVHFCLLQDPSIQWFYQSICESVVFMGCIFCFYFNFWRFIVIQFQLRQHQIYVFVCVICVCLCVCQAYLIFFDFVHLSLIIIWFVPQKIVLFVCLFFFVLILFLDFMSGSLLVQY